MLIRPWESCSTLGRGEPVMDPLVDGEEVDPAVAVGLDVLNVPVGPHALVLDHQLAQQRIADILHRNGKLVRSSTFKIIAEKVIQFSRFSLTKPD